MRAAQPATWVGVRQPLLVPVSFVGVRVVFDLARDRALLTFPGTVDSAAKVYSLDLSTLKQWTRLTLGGAAPHAALTECWFDARLDRMIVLAQDGIWRLRLTPGASWEQQTTVIAPPDHVGAAVVYDLRRHRLLSHGGATANWSRFTGHLQRDFWKFDFAGPDSAVWVMTDSITAESRSSHRAVYDSLSDRFIGFQGSQAWLVTARDTWTLDLSNPLVNSTLAILGPTSDVLANGGARLVLDGSGRALFSLIGTTLFRLALSGSAWATGDSAIIPADYHYVPRTVLDMKRRRLLRFGGATLDTPSDEVWEMALEPLGRWRRLEVAGATPPARSACSIAMDELHDRLLIYGGYAPGTDFTDTWGLSLGSTHSWAPLGASSAYAAYDAPAAFDPPRNRMLVWAYVSHAPPAKLIENRFDDTIGWRLVPSTGVPPSGPGLHPAALDPGRGRWLVSGADPIGGPAWLLWGLDLETNAWSQLGALGTSGQTRDLLSFAFDPVEDRLVIFGGRPYNSDLSTFAFGANPGIGQPVPAGDAPRPREFPWMHHDPLRDAVVLAGGNDVTVGPVCADDFWTLDRGLRTVQRVGVEFTDTTARLQWSIPSVAGHALQLWRRQGAEPWVLQGSATVSIGGAVQFHDLTLLKGERYGYRLVDPAAAGPQPLDQLWLEASPVTEAPLTPVPPAPLLVLGNPARTGVRFRLHLANPEVVSADLFDLQGRPVYHWEARTLTVGDHDFASDDGERTAPGVLFLRTRIGGGVITRRVVALR